MARSDKTRKQLAAELWDRLKRGPSFGIDEHAVKPAEISSRYLGWVNSWILDDVARLVPELREKLDTLGYVGEADRPSGPVLQAAAQQTDLSPVHKFAAGRGFHLTQTGGGCTALERTLADVGLQILITVANDAAAPAEIDEPVLVGLYAQKSADQIATITAPTLPAALAAIESGQWQGIPDHLTDDDERSNGPRRNR